MAGILHTEGMNLLLTSIKSGTVYTLKLGLLKASFSPVYSNTYSTYSSNLANFSGYAAQDLVWGAISNPNPDEASMTATPITFTHSGGATANTIYGYIVYYAATTKVVWAEMFSAPKTMAAAGDVITITLEQFLAQAL